MEKQITVSVDSECNAEYFWDCIRAEVEHCPVSRFGEWLTGQGELPIVVDGDEWAVISSWLKELPGWSDSEHPSYAPHPLHVSQ